MLCAIQMCMYCLADFMFHSVLVCRFNKTIISDGISDHNIYNTCHYRGRQAEENIFKNNMRKLLLTLPLLIFGFITVNAATPSVSSCPQYVDENTTLSCTCTPVDCSVRLNISWDGQLPPSRTLFLPDVRREHNGTQFTCRLDCGGQISTAAYTLQVAYGPTTDKISIQGNSSLMTDGTRTLNLTCLATDLHPAPAYSWLDSLCSNNSQGSTCSFVPQRDDDGKTVICLVSNTFNYQQAEKGVSFNLTYPPVTAPEISPNSTKIVKTGDTLSCTVTGGKPLVLSVNFSCDIPHHPDQNDTKNNESVTSYITIDTSQAPDDNMTCHCSAHWAPQPSYYTNSASASFRTEYPAKMQAFTMNGQNSTVTANETANVSLMCEAHGLPSPNITLQGPHGDDLVGNLTQANDTHSKMEHVIVAVTDTHMGNYTCIANNNVGKNADTSTFTLNVNFEPRLSSSERLGNSTVTAVNMPEDGIDIELRAYPVPNSFNLTVFKDNNDHTGKTISSDSGMFKVTASQRGLGSPEVTCHIRPGYNVQKGWLYMVNISNGFGSVQYYFNVTGVPLPSEETTHGNDLPIIIGVSVGAGVLLIIIIIIIVCCCKKKKKESSIQGKSNPTFNEDDHDNDSGIDEKDSPPLDMSASKPDSRPTQHHLDAGYVDVSAARDGVMRNKSARGQAYEVTSLVKGGGARIAGETTKPPTTNSKGGYAEPWRDFNQDMPDGQPSVNKAPAHTTATRAGNNASPDHYTSPRGEEYASVGEHGKGGTAAKPAAVNTGNSAARTSGDGYAKMDECSGQNPGPHSYSKVESNPKNKPPYVNVRADRPLEMDTSGPTFDSPGYSTVAQASHNKGNKTSGRETHSGAESTDARGSDTYDHFSLQGQQPRPSDPTYAHVHDL